MDNGPPAAEPVESIQATSQPRLRPGPVLRDVAILFGLTFGGGFIIGVAVGNPSENDRARTAIAISNIIFLIVGFTMAGCLVPAGVRWRHLGLVAVGAWLCGLINVVLYGTTIPLWISSGIFIALLMGIGGALSYIFKRP